MDRCILKGVSIIATATLFSGSMFLEAEIVWENTKQEVRCDAGQEQITVKFPFEIIDNQVTITGIRTSCGCTTTKLEKRFFQVGEKSEIEVHFEVGSRVGPQQKYVTVQTDDSQHPSQELELQVYIPYTLKIEPRFIYWNKGVEPYHEQTIDLTADIEQEISIIAISSDTDQLAVRWEKLGYNRFRVYLNPKIPTGTVPFFRSIIKIEIGADIPLKQKLFHAYAFMKNS